MMNDIARDVNGNYQLSEVYLWHQLSGLPFDWQRHQLLMQTNRELKDLS